METSKHTTNLARGTGTPWLPARISTLTLAGQNYDLERGLTVAQTQLDHVGAWLAELGAFAANV